MENVRVEITCSVKTYVDVEDPGVSAVGRKKLLQSTVGEWVEDNLLEGNTQVKDLFGQLVADGSDEEQHVLAVFPEKPR